MISLNFFLFILSVNYFYCDEQIGFRPCCTNCCGCGKHEIPKEMISNSDLEVINEEVVKELEIKKDNKVLKGTEKVAAIKEMMDDKNKMKDYELTPNNEVVYPKEQYFNDYKTITRLDKNDIKEKASKHQKMEGETYDSEILSNMFKKSMNFLDSRDADLKNLKNCKKVGYIDKEGKHDESKRYVSVRYVTRGNNVDFIRNTIFDFVKLNFDKTGKLDDKTKKAEEIWQAKQLIDSSDAASTNRDFNLIKTDDNTYTLKFLKETDISKSLSEGKTGCASTIGGLFGSVLSQLTGNAKNEVTNTIKFINNTDKSFDVSVVSNAIGNTVSPSIYTNIYYSCMYDENENTTYFFVISTLFYQYSFSSIISDIIEQSDSAFNALVGKKFSDKLEKHVTLISNEEKKLQMLVNADVSK